MKSIFVCILLLFAFTIVRAEPKFYCIQLGANSGVSYFEINDINSTIEKDAFTKLCKTYSPFIGFHISSNYLPFLFDFPTDISYSVNVRIPIDGSISTSALKTSSVFFELYAYESLLKDLTVYPILGIGFSQSDLNLIRANSKENANNFEELGTSMTLSKFNALLNLGGGFDVRFNIIDDAIKKENLTIGFAARYSISLDMLGLYDKSWKSGAMKAQFMPQFHSPGLSVEFKIGIEYQKKRY